MCNDNFRSLDDTISFKLKPSTIIVHMNGAHAASIGDMGAKLFFNKLADWFYELWIKMMQISGIVIVTILIVFIVYHTLYRHVHIYHYYGRIRKHEPNRTDSCYVILTTVIVNRTDCSCNMNT